MKTIKHTLICLLAIVLCQCSDYHDIPGKVPYTVTTLPAEEQSYTSATVSYKVNAPYANPEGVKGGVMWGTSADLSNPQIVYSERNYGRTIHLSDLSPETTYYYMGFIEDELGNQIKGEVLSFVTLRGYKDPSEYQNYWEIYSNSIFPGSDTPFWYGFASANYIYLWSQDYTQNGGYVTGFWRYHPKTDSWKKMKDIPSNRVWCSVYCSGEKGYFIKLNRTASATRDYYELWLYDGEIDSWTKLADFPSELIGYNNQIMFMYDSYLYLRDYEGFLWRYDSTKNSWSRIPDSRLETNSHNRQQQASFVCKQKLYIGLGCDSYYKSRYDFWEYDISTSRWTKLSDFPNETNMGEIKWTCFEFNSCGYLIASYRENAGKQNSWIYDPSKDSWGFIDDSANLPFDTNSDGQSFKMGNDVYVFDRSHFWKFNPHNE